MAYKEEETRLHELPDKQRAIAPPPICVLNLIE